MKKYFLLLLILVALPAFKAVSPKEFEIAGKWVAIDKSAMVVLTLDKQGFATFQRGSEMMGGKEFYMNGEKGSMTYSTDFTKTPNELTLTVTKLATGQQRLIKGIFKVVNDNEMLVHLNFENNRPKNFNSKETLALKRSVN